MTAGTQKLISFGILAFGLLFLASGCKSKKVLDKNVDSLVEVFQEDDWEGFQKITTSQVQADISEAEFRRVAAAIKALGSFDDRTMKSLNTTNERTEGTYDLEFEKGEVYLELVLIDDEIAGYNFTGKPLEDALKAVELEEYKDLHVAQFTFLLADETPNPRGNVYPQTGNLTNVPFKLLARGFTPKNAGFKVRVTATLIDQTGTTLMDNDVWVDETIPMPAGKLPGFPMTGSVNAPVGTHTLKLNIQDVDGDRAIEYSQSFVIEPAE